MVPAIRWIQPQPVISKAKRYSTPYT
jgi:hypothetical protein